MNKWKLSKKAISICLSLFIATGGITGFMVHKALADKNDVSGKGDNTAPSASFGISKKKKTDVAILYSSENGTYKDIVFKVKANITDELINANVDANVMLYNMGTYKQPYNFTYTGSVQSFTAPITGTYKLETWGAQGGSFNESLGSEESHGGHGGYSFGTINLQEGQTIYVYVGGQGGSGAYNQSSSACPPGGWNGGGNGDGGWYTEGAGGGGATDIRTSSDGNWNDNLNSRIIVAGGGGGAGDDYNFAKVSTSIPISNWQGGNGGGESSTVGDNGLGSTEVATQSSGYALGQGQPSGSNQAGGGGGYYGGYADTMAYAGGSVGYASCSNSSGGSGYIGGVQSGETIAGNQSFISPDSSQEVGHTGNGYARITCTSSSNSINSIQWRDNSLHFIVDLTKDVFTETEKNIYNFFYTGNVQTFTAPVAGTYKLEVWGAQGGADGESQGGYGGYSTGTINLTAGQSINVYVGSQGGSTSSSSVAGGWNGGGNGGSTMWRYGSGGGGASDIRTSNELTSRIIVAGGGGGADANDYDGSYGVNGQPQQGGDGGGLQSTIGNQGSAGRGYSLVGGPATQTSGYALGKGENGIYGCAAGGGGGYYGGYSGDCSCSDSSGGSGYVGGVQNGQTIAGNQPFTSPTGTQETGHTGNGYARITGIGTTTPTITSADSVACMENKNIYFIGTLTSDYKDKVNSLIQQLDGRGTYIEHSTIDTDLQKSEAYIMSVLNQQQDNSNIFLVGDEVNYNETYKDSEGDRKNDELWKYEQDNKHLNYDDDFVKCSQTGDLKLDNDLGTASFATGQWMHNKVTTFDKPGKYKVSLKVQDNPTAADDDPSGDSNFNDYDKWSPDDNSVIINVHRKPTPVFTAYAVANASTGKFDIIQDDGSKSYDIDHQYSDGTRKGIVNKKFQWKEVTDGVTDTWHDGKLPSPQAPNKDFLVKLSVQDLEGQWSDDLVKYVTTKNENLPPVAQFTENETTMPVDQLQSDAAPAGDYANDRSDVAFTDNSYDPNGDSIRETWTVTDSSGNTIYTGSTKPTASVFYGKPLGTYNITLVCDDGPTPKIGVPLTSDPYTLQLTLVPINHKPVAHFEVDNTSKEPENIKITEDSSDPDDDPIDDRIWTVTDSSGNVVEQSENKLPDLSTLDGTYTLTLKVKDNPKIPPELWSNPYSQQITVESLKLTGTLYPNPAEQGQQVTFDITTTGNAKYLRIYLPDDITSRDTKGTSFPIAKTIKEEYIHNEKINYILPINTPVTLDSNGNRIRQPYEIPVNAQKENGASKSITLYLDVKGNVLDGIKTEIIGTGQDRN